MVPSDSSGGQPSAWQSVMVAGSGLEALRAGQACTELGLVWHGSDGRRGNELVAHARRLGCDLLHPAEAKIDDQFSLAKASRAAGLAFVGPRDSLVAAMHDPAASRQLMREAGVPLSPVEDASPPLHLPVLADTRGQALALMEHEILCPGRAVAPSDRLTPEQRAYLGQLAVKGAQSIGLVGLATLSFTLVGNRLGFVTMRPGLTGYEGLAEVLTGLDLAVEQLRLVGGGRLRRPRVGHMGHGPGRPGQARLRLLSFPGGFLSGGPGVRLDRPRGDGVGAPDARLLVWGRDAAEAERRERRAMTEWQVSSSYP
ncbi:ATP-binding protein [Halomonas alkalisoli]|uniref:ATP-binding protein n=1 Tax=Halomonas alkalisoli TaxID=2907158 RepID=UPI001F3252C5|nr:hypothetical protein [Halomonas alkalisoli]MCE9683184.1 hypothetical protein [Halomonas alkalisoli]